MKSTDQRGRVTTAVANQLYQNLLTNEEIETVIENVLQQTPCTPLEIAKIIAWCNSVRLNQRLLIGLLLNKLSISDIRNGEPIFTYVETTATKTKRTRNNSPSQQTESATGSDIAGTSTEQDS